MDKQQILSLIPGGHLQQRSIGVISKSGCSFLIQDKLINLTQPINSVLEFLTELFSSGFCYSAINVAYSALSSVVALQGNDTIRENKLIKRLFNGVFN